MAINTTAWNRLRYSLAAPVYDQVTAPLQAIGFESARRRALELLDPQPGSRVLIVGAGTGLDLDVLPPGVEVVATDLSAGMVEQLERRAQKLGRKVEGRVMDAESLALPDEEFDHAIAHLILAVMPDPDAGARELARVLKPGGTISIFDKFVPDGEAPSLARRAANHLTSALFSDFTRQLGPILEAGGLTLRWREKAVFDFFTIAIAAKPVADPSDRERAPRRVRPRDDALAAEPTRSQGRE
jgi:ubiquinone/menaquinone biosynthesis C-methylase UbiE